ncbi:zf-HC2 domain-containing protein [Dyella psychrodurans]|uniref:Zf-HC2 domain-containing protein n=1 Tax=Dyella psychrodurans TaxID=1927960 RepID=A0A370X109_9GAMM|nr:zf-HC2 domain-containing protein [Dyella psychrodurans]RDS81951.1 zf-HC2 domain-containing protein [Dyella psychrodurans]
MSYPMDTGQDCLRAWEAMPWVLQESATQEQSQWLDRHLVHCASCRAEFEQQNRLRLALSLPTEIHIDANAGLKRLMDRIDAPVREETPHRLRSGSWLTRGLVAAVMVQAIAIGALSMKFWSAGEAPAYRTLSEESAPVAAGSIRVVPDASMTLTDWNALLHSLRLQVVGGPNDMGAYTVAPANSTVTTQQALKQLRAARGIRLAEPIVGTP